MSGGKAARGIGGSTAASAAGGDRCAAPVVVRLADFRSTLVDVDDAQGAAMLVAALRNRPRVVLVGQPRATATESPSPHEGGIPSGCALVARLTAIDASQARHWPRADAVVVDLTACDWLGAQALDSLTVLKRVGNWSWRTPYAASLRAAVEAALEDAVSQLVPRLDGGRR